MPGRFETTKRFVKRVPRRFAVLLPLIIACVLISRAHILSVGGSYEIAFPEYAGHEVGEQNIQIDPPGMATVEEIWQDEEGEPHVRFRAG